MAELIQQLSQSGTQLIGCNVDVRETLKEQDESKGFRIRPVDYRVSRTFMVSGTAKNFWSAESISAMSNQVDVPEGYELALLPEIAAPYIRMQYLDQEPGTSFLIPIQGCPNAYWQMACDPHGLRWFERLVMGNEARRIGKYAFLLELVPKTN